MTTLTTNYLVDSLLAKLTPSNITSDSNRLLTTSSNNSNFASLLAQSSNSLAQENMMSSNDITVFSTEDALDSQRKSNSIQQDLNSYFLSQLHSNAAETDVLANTSNNLVNNNISTYAQLIMQQTLLSLSSKKNSNEANSAATTSTNSSLNLLNTLNASSTLT